MADERRARKQEPIPRAVGGWWLRARGFAFWLLLLSAVGIFLGRILVREQLDAQIRKLAERKLAESCPGLVVQVASARRVRGRGIELRGLRFTDPQRAGSDRELLEIERAMLAAPTELSQIISGGGIDVFGVALEGVHIRAVRDAKGAWNIAKLAEWRTKADTSIPKVSVRDARMEISDAGHSARPIEIHGISADFAATADGWTVQAKLTADRFGRLTAVGNGDLESGSWSVQGVLSELELSSELLRLLPRDLSAGLESLEHIRAQGELRYSCRGGPGRRPQFRVQGTIHNGRLDDARLPYPINDIAARVNIDSSAIRVSEVAARMAGATLRVDAEVRNWLERPSVRCDISATDLMIDRRIRGVLSSKARDVWDRFNPSGLSDVHLTVRWTPQQPSSWDLSVRCRDVSIVFDRCPYPLHHLQGVINLGPSYARADDLLASAAGTPLHIHVDMDTRPGAWRGLVELQTDGLVPIDRRLIGSLSPRAQEFLTKLEPTGLVRLQQATFSREQFEDEVQSRVHLDIVDGSIVFADFPYPLTRISGRLSAENDRWKMDDFIGHHGTTVVHAEGHWAPEPNRPHTVDLAMRIVAKDVDLDLDLREAINVRAPSFDAMWRSLRPRGVIDEVSATLRFRTSRGLENLSIAALEEEPRSASTSRGVAIHPTWFPYALERVTGRVEFSNGAVQLQSISGWHDDTQVRLGGSGQVSRDGPWQLTLNRISADRVEVNRGLTEALPGALGRALESVGLEGLLVVDGTLTLSGRPRQPPAAQWSLRVDVAAGRMQVGIPLEQIHGGVQLVGSAFNGNFECTGEWDIDSLYANGIQVSRIAGPMRVDPRRVRLGAWAEANRTDRPPRSMTGRVFGGQMSLDAAMALASPATYQLQLSLTQASLAALAQQLRRAAAGDLRGQVDGLLKMRGEVGVAHTRRGEGVIRLRDATLYELPVVVALLSVLSLKSPERSAFNRADIDYRIEGDQIQLDRIDLIGNAITLKGRGWANLQQEILLNFYSLVGRDEYQVPLLRFVLAEASKRILEIQVAGTLSDPRVQRTAFPELDETLRRLFPELGSRPRDGNLTGELRR